MDFAAVFAHVFETDEVPTLNGRLRLFIMAEEIPPAVARVCRFLRTTHGVDVSCMAVSAYETEAGEILVSTELITGQEDVAGPRRPRSPRWSGDKSVKQVVWEAALELTKGEHSHVFAPKEVTEAVLKKYPTFNRSTVGCQIISDCVNHTSRHHYPGGEDRYWWVDWGKYRLYDGESQ